MRIAVNFVGEDGIDCDGLSRELCDLVAEALVAPIADTGRPLFLLCSASGYSLPHPFADRIPLNPHLFRQLGIFFGKAVLDTLCGATRHIGLRLAPSFTKYLLDIPSDPADLQALDAMLYENLINHFLECNVQEYAQAVHMSDTLLFEDTIYNPDASFSGEQKTFRQLDPDTQQPRIVTEESKRDYILFLGTPHELSLLTVDWLLKAYGIGAAATQCTTAWSQASRRSCTTFAAASGRYYRHEYCASSTRSNSKSCWPEPHRARPRSLLPRPPSRV